jgi:ubiquinone/menaquinone biosynthesis C-methylase UbiE
VRSARLIDPEGAETAALAEVVDFTGLRVLEIGCGDGRLTLRYADAAAAVLAVDPAEELVGEARALLPGRLRDRVRFAVAGATDFVVPKASIDLAFFSWSL